MTPKLVVFLLPVVLGLPFIGRAYFVDDHYHMAMAKGLLENPLRPYDFRADDDGADNLGWERGRLPRMVNPPLHHYLMGLFWKIGGGRLWVVRLLSLFLAGGTAVFIYLLAARMNVPPLPVAVLASLTPVFWLSSYALLIDSTLLFFFQGGLWMWVEGLRERSPRWLAAAGLFMGLSIVTKYTGVLLLPVAGLFWLMDARSGRPWRALWTFLIPLAVLGVWSGWNVATYGAVHLTESSKRVMQSFAWSHVLVFLTFLSGVFLLPLQGWVEAARAGRKSFLLWALGASGLAAVLASPWGGFSRFQSLAMAALAAGGAAFLLSSARQVRRSAYPSDLFLLGWLLLGAVQMVYVMQWVAARYYLTIMVPAVILTYRLWQERHAHRPMSLARSSLAWGVGLFLLSGAVAVGDYLQAETSRRIVRDVAAQGLPGGGRRGFFLGDSFTGSYLKAAGWIPAFQDTRMAPGDLILQQEVIMPRWWFRIGDYSLEPVGRFDYPSVWPVRVMDNLGSAGFYASAWGALPFTLSRDSLERYTLHRVREPGRD